MLLPDQTYEQCQNVLAPTSFNDGDFVKKSERFNKRINNNDNNILIIHKNNKWLIEDDNINNNNNINNEDGKQVVEKNADDATESTSAESYENTSEFFNNIPDYNGEPMGPFNIPNKKSIYHTNNNNINSNNNNNNNNDTNNSNNNNNNKADILRECELFLFQHRIRPDFFCKYQTALKVSKSAPPSWPLPKKNRNKNERKLQSESPPSPMFQSNNFHIINSNDNKNDNNNINKNAGIPNMQRFKKSTAIYTLPMLKKTRESRDAKRKSIISSFDASSSNEAVHLQQRLKCLSSELVTLRNSLQVTGGGCGAGGKSIPPAVTTGNGTTTTNKNNNTSTLPSVTTNTISNGCNGNISNGNGNAGGNGIHCNGGTGMISDYHQLTGTNNVMNGGGLSGNHSNNMSIPTIHKIHNKANHITATNNSFQHGNNSMPIISPRNTSIPHPLPSINTVKMSKMSQYRDGLIAARRSQGIIIDLPATKPRILSPNRINNIQKCSTLPVDMEDLIHLPGPLTEDAVMGTLQARFGVGKHFTNVGPILLSINPYQDVGNPLTLTSTRTLLLAPQLKRIVQEAVRQQAETGYPQAIILSGTSGAGKTHCSMLLLRQLFAVAGGGPETDAFKHLAAAFTVLRSLGSAKTSTNSESSRIGQFIEVQVTDGALYRTKIHCYFLDQTRVIRPLPNEKNYHIFYQMLAGLTCEERIKLHLNGYSPINLKYLQTGDVKQHEHEDAARFQAWKTCLGILGIPFMDVVRVLAAVLLLGNVQFVDGQGLEVDVKGESELNAIASLLGITAPSLFRGLTTRTHNARGQLIKSVCDANMSNMTRDSLAKALYCRTVATIVRRANSLKRLGSTLGTLSSDSNDSVHNQADIASQHTSTIGGANAGSKSMAALNNAVRHATDGFIGILDMFGFEEPRPAQLEHLCINLCAETMQHFYNTHIFKSSVESCRDEGIICDTEVDYVDNVPCIDLISSLRTGLLSMLDTECSIRGTAENYVVKIKVQHKNSTRLETNANTKHITTTEFHDPRMFTIRHFAGRVDYDTTDFLDTNRDVVPDDLVSVFYKHTCNFGFATHLFGSELKALYALETVPRGLSFRIAPTSHTDLLNGDEPVSTLTQDFHTRLDNLLRTLVHARPHFVRCIRSNCMETENRFERQTIVRQIRALQVLETVNLMASGFPHRMRFKQFTARYRMLAPFRLLRRCDDKALEDCKIVLQYALENPPEFDSSVTLTWAPGKRHVFLSEGIRQLLEKLRTNVRTKSAIIIQAVWRGWQLRRRIGSTKRPNKRNIHHIQSMMTTAAAAAAAAAAATSSVNLLNGHLSVMNNATSVNVMQQHQQQQQQQQQQQHQQHSIVIASNGHGGHRLVSTKTASNTNAGGTTTRPRPQPIAGTPPPDPNEKCDAKTIQQTCNLFGLDLERPPPVPPSRPYTVTGNSKLGYPQTRIMKMNFPEDSVTYQQQPIITEQLRKGEPVTVVGASHRRGHLIVEHNSISYHVPFQFMELIKTTLPIIIAPSSTGQAAVIVNGTSSGTVNI